MEQKIETTNWATRVGTLLLGMILVDTWLVYQACTGSTESQSDFYTLLSEELIDNAYNEGVFQLRCVPVIEPIITLPEMIHPQTGQGRAGVAAHLTLTNKKRKTKNGEVTNHHMQGQCQMCSKKTTYVCSQCQNEVDDFVGGVHCIPWLCHTKTGRMCFPNHVSNSHLFA